MLNYKYDMYPHVFIILKGCTVYTTTLAPSKPTHLPIYAESSQSFVGLWYFRTIVLPSPWVSRWLSEYAPMAPESVSCSMVHDQSWSTTTGIEVCRAVTATIAATIAATFTATMVATFFKNFATCLPRLYTQIFKTSSQPGFKPATSFHTTKSSSQFS
jgi:hypothetical protein